MLPPIMVMTFTACVILEIFSDAKIQIVSTHTPKTAIIAAKNLLWLFLFLCLELFMCASSLNKNHPDYLGNNMASHMSKHRILNAIFLIHMSKHNAKPAIQEKAPQKNYWC